VKIKQRKQKVLERKVSNLNCRVLTVAAHCHLVYQTFSGTWKKKYLKKKTKNYISRMSFDP
jgi:hypothetical protein